MDIEFINRLVERPKEIDGWITVYKQSKHEFSGISDYLDTLDFDTETKQKIMIICLIREEEKTQRINERNIARWKASDKIKADKPRSRCRNGRCRNKK